MKRPHEIRAEDFPIKIRPKAKDLDEILPLITLCASGKLYEVEEWIRCWQTDPVPPIG